MAPAAFPLNAAFEVARQLAAAEAAWEQAAAAVSGLADARDAYWLMPTLADAANRLVVDTADLYALEAARRRRQLAGQPRRRGSLSELADELGVSKGRVQAQTDRAAALAAEQEQPS